jgi:ABC-type polar amino acid transport system ATPase subunit
MITIDKLTKTYGDHTVLNGVSLSIQDREIVGVIGPSGSGKSTLLRCLGGLEKIDSGQFSIKGKLGMVFQHFNVFPHMTVLENLTYGPIHVLKISKHEAETRAFELLEEVGLVEKAHAYPKSLSGGQKQRVAIVRALAMHSDIILFDEPTSALDPEMVQEVLKVIQRFSNKGITMLIATHEMRFLKNVSTRVLLLDQGQVVEDRPTADFFAGPATPKGQQFLQTFFES